MKKSSIYDIGFMVLLALVLTLLNKFVSEETPNIFLYVPVLAVYFIGRYISIYLIKKDLKEHSGKV